MIRRRTLLGFAATSLLPGKVFAAGPVEEPKFLSPYILAGLPSMAERLPLAPRVVKLAEMGRAPGRYGGTARMLIGGQRDIRLMTIYGYARLVGFDEKLRFQPDILERCDIEDERIFTFRIRERHRWSDGTLVSVEDFRYTWEDVLLHEDLSDGGISRALLVGGKLPRFEVVDDRTVRYSWTAPNPNFLPALAAAQALSLLMPSHYLKQFHQKFQDANKLAALIKENRVRRWTQLHIRMSRQYRPENPELPTLDPWRNTTKPPADQFVFERNPYFHRVDENGRQLPYIDKFILNVSSSSIIAPKTGAGDSDLQAYGLNFDDYTFLKEAEKRFPIKVSLWKPTYGSRLALLPNLNYADDTWRGLLRDVRFRRALSLAINRREINMAVFYGLARESADTVLPESPLYKPEFAKAWATFEPDRANRLLDEIGLTQRDDDDIRLLPDGRPAKIVVETAGENTLETDLMELVTDYWRNIGIAVFVRTSQREVFRSRAVGGEIMMSIWGGLDNGVPTADMNPGYLAPTTDDQLQWPVFGLSYLSRGKQGKKPDMPDVIRQVELLDRWSSSPDIESRAEVWNEMLTNYTDRVFTIGIVNSTRQPVVRNAKMKNVPETALYGFEPTSFLGIYMPDTFWYDKDS